LLFDYRLDGDIVKLDCRCHGNALSSILINLRGC
jgi:hypothetical protein